jgi:hypothetical protein
MEKKREWLVFGLLIIPVVIVVSLLIGLATDNYILWITLPSILFEQMFEKCCYAFSNNQIANFIFAILLWFLVGAAIGKSAFFSTVFKKGAA